MRVPVLAHLRERAVAIASMVFLLIDAVLPAAGQLAVSVPDTAARYGEAISIPVRVGNTDGQGIVSFEIFLSYDGDLLSAFSVGTTGALVSPAWSQEMNIAQGNGTPVDTVKVAMATDSDTLSGAGELFRLHFQVADRRSPAASLMLADHALFNDGVPQALTASTSFVLQGNDGSLSSSPSSIVPRDIIALTLVEVDENRDGGAAESLQVRVRNGGQTESLTVTEDGNGTGRFTGTIGTAFSQTPVSGDGTVQAQAGDVVEFCYDDSLDGNGATVERCATTQVIGGTDGQVRVSRVAQPGDTLRVRVTDADLNGDPESVESAVASAVNRRTGAAVAVALQEVDVDDQVFFGRLPTAGGAGGAEVMGAAKGDTIDVVYGDVVTGLGGQEDRAGLVQVVYPFGDADGNGDVQAFDAAQVLLHRLSPFLSGLDSLAANVDVQAPIGPIDPFDASLIL